jgi:(1->4)-alpha-D-glucan 1-alpha-D-glucosylmutase
LLRTREDGRVKLFLIYRALKARNERPKVFRSGAYVPLEVAGRFKDHIIAFARNQGKEWAITIVPRFLTTLIREGEDPFGLEIWEDTHISVPEGIAQGWKNMITGQQVNNGRKLIIGGVLAHFPVALLMKEENL